MHPTPESLPRLTPCEYLDWEDQQETRHELVDGYLYAMTGASLRHDEIAMNLAAALHAHLRDGPCRVYKSDIKIQVANNFYYPDIAIRYSGEDESSLDRYSIADPVVVIEVLSPSTQRFDRGDKRLAYQQIPSLHDYILVAQNRVFVEQYTAGCDPTSKESDDEILAIESIGFSIELAEIYR